jgi:hypothetical protein
MFCHHNYKQALAAGQKHTELKERTRYAEQAAAAAEAAVQQGRVTVNTLTLELTSLLATATSPTVGTAVDNSEIEAAAAAVVQCRALLEAALAALTVAQQELKTVEQQLHLHTTTTTTAVAVAPVNGDATLTASAATSARRSSKAKRSSSSSVPLSANDSAAQQSEQHEHVHSTDSSSSTGAGGACFVCGQPVSAVFVQQREQQLRADCTAAAAAVAAGSTAVTAARAELAAAEQHCTMLQRVQQLQSELAVAKASVTEAENVLKSRRADVASLTYDLFQSEQVMLTVTIAVKSTRCVISANLNAQFPGQSM